MRFARITFAVIICVSFFSGCGAINKAGVNTKSPHPKYKHKKTGPPPHAPAHGYRHKQQNGVELRYDSDLGVYSVINMPNVYFHKGHYLRFSNGHWEKAKKLRGPWRKGKKIKVPNKLRKAKEKKYKKKKKKHKEKKKKLKKLSN